MDPLSIAAICTGLVALAGAVGACLVPLCRKQENSAGKESLISNSDSTVLNITEPQEYKFNCCGLFSFSSNKGAITEFVLSEADRNLDHVKALRSASGYQNYSSSQPQSRTAVPVPASASLPATTTIVQEGSATVAAGDGQLLEDVDMKSVMIDSRNQIKFESLIINKDGTCEVKGFSSFVSPISSTDGPKESHLTHDISKQTVEMVKDTLIGTLKQILQQAGSSIASNGSQETDALLVHTHSPQVITIGNESINANSSEQ